MLETHLRNGIGHHAAHYDPALDEVILYDRKGAAIAQKIGYTQFCDKVLRLFAAVELRRHTIAACTYRQMDALSKVTMRVPRRPTS